MSRIQPDEPHFGRREQRGDAGIDSDVIPGRSTRPSSGDVLPFRRRPLTDRPRPTVRGKFLFVGDEKLFLRGVTYGTFRPDDEGREFTNPAVVESDFKMMVANGINAIRTYTVPPRWLLDLAARSGIYVMVGVPWEHHVAFLEERRRARGIERRVREGVRACAGHPAVLCYAIGNEIPASIARWHGRRRMERFIERLYRAALEEDPGALVTYVNFPSTEYLHLPFLDLVCFNVFLESEPNYSAYLARLQNIAADRPLVITEVGLDSHRAGELAQAEALDWQVRASFELGCAGTFVFSWTDEWHRGGHDVEDWAFGLTDHDRRPKLALEAAKRAFAAVPIAREQDWPRVSVVMCTYNGARTIGETLRALSKLDYPDYEVIVVNDGSVDQTREVVEAYADRFGYRVIETENRGLSSARNTGLEAATGEIVAYIDDDAYPDPDWLTYLAVAFARTPHVGIGGPNLAPPGDSPVAQCVDNAPGGPVHVLLTDEIAEHIPGCNMAFKREALEAVGGFDPRFRVAGDDVDICWRLQEQDWTLGFSPAALVWHHRRGRVLEYWRQQRGYGRAEALLEEKWPDRYNGVGHLTWGGRVYGTAKVRGRRAWRVYHGIAATAPFQPLEPRSSGLIASLPTMPEWQLVLALLTVLSGLSFLWRPMLMAVPLLAAAVVLTVGHAVLAGLQARFSPRLGLGERARRRALTGLLHFIQPIARLYGRFRAGLTPWRGRGRVRLSFPAPREWSVWSERWQPHEGWVEQLADVLREENLPVLHGNPYGHWDLEVRHGATGGVRVQTTVEEHGYGRQLVRFRCWPLIGRGALLTVGFFGFLAGAAAFDGAWIASLILAAASLLVFARGVEQCAAATSAVKRAARARK